MRIAVCSDIHGNVVAFQAVLADMQRHGFDRLYVAGDLVFGGPRPAETMALLRSLPDTHLVMGNCDYYIADPNDRSADTLFARAHLAADDLAVLAALPLTETIAVAPGHSLLICHANPQNLEDPIKPEAPEALIRPLLDGVTADIIAFGHYHVPFVRSLPPWTLVDVSSVGLPMDGDQRAVWAMLEWNGTTWAIQHHRVAYDWDAVARDLVQVGFPNAAGAAARLLQARY